MRNVIWLLLSMHVLASASPMLSGPALQRNQNLMTRPIQMPTPAPRPFWGYNQPNRGLLNIGFGFGNGGFMPGMGMGFGGMGGGFMPGMGMGFGGMGGGMMPGMGMGFGGMGGGMMPGMGFGGMGGMNGYNSMANNNMYRNNGPGVNSYGNTNYGANNNNYRPYSNSSAPLSQNYLPSSSSNYDNMNRTPIRAETNPQFVAARNSQRTAMADESIGSENVTYERVATTNTDNFDSSGDRVASTDPEYRTASTSTRQRAKGVSEPRTAKTVRGANVIAHNNGERSAQHAPVWNRFIRNFQQCAPGCVPTGYAAYGHRGHPTCHSSGRAIDVAGMDCGGRHYRAIDRGYYAKMVSCMKTKMKVLYFNGPQKTLGHRDHAHFSIGCYNGRYW